MIFVTVGMQLGFDRLIKAMDAISPRLDQPVIAQTGAGSFAPQNMTAHTQMSADEFQTIAEQADLIVSHAGIGTVLAAQRLGKPIVLMPRRADRHEHRNDHQLGTVRQLNGRPGILVAQNEGDLEPRIAEGLMMGSLELAPSSSAEALNAAVAKFIATGSL